jgi:hypothetical protein
MANAHGTPTANHSGQPLTVNTQDGGKAVEVRVRANGDSTPLDLCADFR